MKLMSLCLFAVAVAGCGKKSTPTPAAAPTPEPTAAVAEPEHEVSPRPDPDAAPELPSNADFNAKIQHVDGTVVSGHVKRIERSEDWYGEKGWTDKPAKLTVALEGGGTEIEAQWKDIRSVDIKYGSKADIDCQFDSEYTPLMYMCVLKSTATVKSADGKTWEAGSRHKWRFVFDDGQTQEFWIKKLPERMQEEDEGDGTDQGPALYLLLQKKVLEAASSTAVSRIEITE